MSLSNFAENEIADWIAGNGAPSAVTTCYVQLHTGDPGEDGTANVSAETTRVAASFGAAVRWRGHFYGRRDLGVVVGRFRVDHFRVVLGRRHGGQLPGVGSQHRQHGGGGRQRLRDSLRFADDHPRLMCPTAPAGVG